VDGHDGRDFIQACDGMIFTARATVTAQQLIFPSSCHDLFSFQFFAKRSIMYPFYVVILRNFIF
jgi:hypothetical protein